MRLAIDHSSLQPLDGSDNEQAGKMWLCVSTNLCAIDESFAGLDHAAAAAKAVLRRSAVKLLSLKE